MATLCKNCAAPLVFDPATQRVVCRSCGSSWTAEEVESSDKAVVSDKAPVSAEEVYGKDDDEILGFDEVKKDYMDCYIYTCNSCGGEIAINGTDISTKCIYCGNTNVVFSRIAKEKAPEFIIPFQSMKTRSTPYLSLIRTNQSMRHPQLRVLSGKTRIPRTTSVILNSSFLKTRI